MKKIIILAVIFLFSLIVATFAQDVSLKAQVDKASLTLDETLTYRIVITSLERNSPSLKTPDFKDFNLVSQAQSSTISWIKSKTKTIIVYTFILSPRAIGNFRIEPGKIKIEGKTYATDAFSIEVTKPKPSEPEESLPEEPLPQTKEPQITL